MTSLDTHTFQVTPRGVVFSDTCKLNSNTFVKKRTRKILVLSEPGGKVSMSTGYSPASFSVWQIDNVISPNEEGGSEIITATRIVAFPKR